MKATVVITTKNRCEELRVALASCRAQTARPEIIVIDDASTDGTTQLVLEEFPEAKYVQHVQSEGCIQSRNEGAALATGNVIFSIDDDAEFSTPFVIEQTLRDFDDARIAVVAIPLIEPRYGERRLQFAPDRDARWIVDTFKGTAYAIYREAFLDVGGFRADLVHQGEESDLSIRLLDRSKFVRLGRSDPILHYESPRRDLRRMHFFGRRNDLLFAFRNVPFRSLLLHALGTTWNGLKTLSVSDHPSVMAHGIFLGWMEGIKTIRRRKPVSQKTYKLYRRLRAHGAVPIEYAFCRLK